MRCPHLMSFDKEMCVTAETAIIPSGLHRANFCIGGSHWACPIKASFTDIAHEFSYSI